MGDDYSEDLESGTPNRAPKKEIPSKPQPSSKGSKKVSKKVSTSKTVVSGPGIPEKVDFMWTVALVVAAFVIGFFVRGITFAPEAEPIMPPEATMGMPDSSLDGGDNGGAPALDDSQLQQGMPSGHPNIDSTDSGDTQSGTSGEDPATDAGKSDVPTDGSPSGNSVDGEKDPGN